MTIAQENAAPNKTKYMGFTASAKLAEWLEAKAAEEHRSISGQITLILDKERKAQAGE